MQEQLSFPRLFVLPQPLPLHQPPSEVDIKTNLQKYSPFYKQAMHFDKAEVKTLFYVAHGNFSSEKAVEKLQAFELFKDKEIFFVEFRGDKRGPVRDAGVEEGDDEGVHEQPRGNSAHFTVKVKNKGRYTFRELEISADGKCGIASSIAVLSEISRGETPLSPEVLIRGVSVVSDPPQNGDIVQSDPNNPFDDLLKKIYKPKVEKDRNGKDVYGDLKLHHCVRDGLTSESLELQPITGNLSPQSLEKVRKLLTRTQESGWLEPKHVYEILTTNSVVTEKITAGELQNISAGNIFSFQAAIPATLVAGESLPQHLEDFSAPNPFNQTLTRAGNPNEGMELEPDKTLKHEFRIIVLNILHEWIEGKDCKFSKINEDKFLESLIKEKLGDESVEKIKTELGGKITFKSLLAIDEDLSPQVASSTTLSSQVASPTALTSIPEELDKNQTEQLKKEREAFYSAPCGDGKKVFEKILDIAEKFCQDSSLTRDEYSKNEVILLEDLKQVLGNSSRISLDYDGQIKLASIKSLIETLEEEHLSDFTDELVCRLAIKPKADAPAQPAHTPRAPALAPAPRAHAPAFAPPAAVPPAPRAHAPALAPTPRAPAQTDPAPTANPPRVGVDDYLAQLGKLMETARGAIVKAFEDLSNSIKANCREAREDLLKKVNEMKKNIEQSEKKLPKEQGKQGNKQASETPDKNPLKPGIGDIFSVLRSCLGEERK